VTDGSARDAARTRGARAAALACSALLLAAGAPEGEVAPPVGTAPAWTALEILGKSVAPGEKRRLSLATTESFAGARVPTPVIVARGTAPGPTLCLTGGVHGDELNGIEIVRRTLEEVRPEQLAGTLIGAPIVNVHGFRRGSRYLPDRRDLNRFFPGSERGSPASRIAHAVFRNLIVACDALVDIHSGSFHRTNLAQVRGDVANDGVLRLARGFGAPIVVHHTGRPGTLRRAALDSGIPSITYEAGEPMRFQRDEITRGVRGVERLSRALGMLAAEPASADPAANEGSRAALEPTVFMRSRWVRVDDGGILTSAVGLGDRVERATLLGLVIDPIAGHRAEIRAPWSGLVIGLAQDQLVIPGFAAFHIALAPETPPGRALEEVGSGAPAHEGPEPEIELEERPE
jgi:predicted deacylase